MRPPEIFKLRAEVLRRRLVVCVVGRLELLTPVRRVDPDLTLPALCRLLAVVEDFVRAVVGLRLEVVLPVVRALAVVEDFARAVVGLRLEVVLPVVRALAVVRLRLVVLLRELLEPVGIGSSLRYG